MAIDTITELFTGRVGNDTFTRQRTYTRTFEVYTTDPNDGPGTAGFDLGLPRLGDAHPEDSQSVVVTYNVAQDDADPLRWIITCSYDTQPTLPEALQPGDSGSGVGEGVGTEQPIGTVPDNPLNRPAVWRFGFTQTAEVLREAYQTDEFGANLEPTAKTKPVLNSAGFAFDPPVMVEVSRPIITVTKNLPGLILPSLELLQDAINSDTWYGMDPFTVRCVGIEATSGQENGVKFWAYTFSFAIKRDTWLVRVLDAGYAERALLTSYPSPEYKVIQFLDENGSPVSQPVPLDGNGRRLTALPEAYLVFSAYPQVAYNNVVPL